MEVLKCSVDERAYRKPVKKNMDGPGPSGPLEPDMDAPGPYFGYNVDRSPLAPVETSNKKRLRHECVLGSGI